MNPMSASPYLARLSTSGAELGLGATKALTSVVRADQRNNHPVAGGGDLRVQQERSFEASDHSDRDVKYLLIRCSDRRGEAGAVARLVPRATATTQWPSSTTVFSRMNSFTPTDRVATSITSSRRPSTTSIGPRTVACVVSPTTCHQQSSRPITMARQVHSRRGLARKLTESLVGCRHFDGWNGEPVSLTQFISRKESRSWRQNTISTNCLRKVASRWAPIWFKVVIHQYF